MISICHWSFLIPSGYLSHSHGKWPIEIDGLPINSMVMFHGKLLVITRWYIYIYIIVMISDVCIFIPTRFDTISIGLFLEILQDLPSGNLT